VTAPTEKGRMETLSSSGQSVSIVRGILRGELKFQVPTNNYVLYKFKYTNKDATEKYAGQKGLQIAIKPNRTKHDGFRLQNYLTSFGRLGQLRDACGPRNPGQLLNKRQHA